MHTLTRLTLCGVIFAAAVSCAGDSDYLPSKITAFAPEDCKPVVEQEIDHTPIDRSKITDISYIAHQFSGGETGEEYRYQAWLSFNSCTGHYVIDMNRYCQVDRRFTTAQCTLEKIVASK